MSQKIALASITDPKIDSFEKPVGEMNKLQYFFIMKEEVGKWKNISRLNFQKEESSRRNC
jgi:hypothetical protein